MGDTNEFANHHRGSPSGHRAFAVHPRTTVSKLSDAKLRQHKKVQANLSIIGATIGLGALSAKGGAGAARKFVKPAQKGHLIARKLENHTTTALTVGAGVGGLAGYNAAAINRAEAKRPTYPQHIRKDWAKYDRDRHVGLVRHYGASKPLPENLTREQRQEIWHARDKHLNRKRDSWERRGKASDAVRIAGEATAGTVGAGLGAMSLRDAYQREHPGKLEAKAVKRGGLAVRAVAAKPTFKMLAIGGAGAIAGAAGRRGKNVSEKKARKYSTRAGGTASAAVSRLNKSATLSAFGVDHR